MIVRVFRNLTRRCFSVQARTEGRWVTCGHADTLRMEDVRFFVSEAGRQRVLRKGRRQVHAWAQGRLLCWTGKDAPSKSDAALASLRGTPGDVFCDTLCRVGYSPLRGPHFTQPDGTPVERAPLVAMAAPGDVRACLEG